MKTLRVKDNSSLLKEEFDPVTDIVDRIADKTLGQLEKKGFFVFPELVKNSEDLTKDQMILKSINDHYVLGNVMGILGHGHERLIIESRFSTDRQDYFLQYMLEKVMHYPSMLNLNINSNQENRLFNLILFLFPYYLKKAMSKGSFKIYVNQEYNDANLKGTINIPRQIKENTPFLGNVTYSIREFSYDNYLMELVRHTIEFIKRKTPEKTLLGKVQDEVKSVRTITQGYRPQDKAKIIQVNKKNPVVHAFYHEYRTLQRLCILILQYEKYQTGSGKQQVFGILFDGSWLWEEYISTLIKDEFYHPMNKGEKGGQKLFSTEKSKIGLVYPDFISKNSKNRIIADTKYKPIENIGNKDYLQILAYMFRFDAKKGYYLYPDTNAVDDLRMKLNQGTTYQNNVTSRKDIVITKCGLTIPGNAKSYADFVVKITASERELLDKLLSKS